MSAADLAARAKSARAWLFEAMFPLWSSAGFDAASGQFVEQLAPGGAPDLAAPSPGAEGSRLASSTCSSPAPARWAGTALGGT